MHAILLLHIFENTTLSNSVMEGDNKNLLTNFIFLKVIAIYTMLLAQQQSSNNNQ